VIGESATYKAEYDVVKAAKALFRGYAVEDSHAEAWKTDDVLDYRLHALFLAVEALEALEEK